MKRGALDALNEGDGQSLRHKRPLAGVAGTRELYLVHTPREPLRTLCRPCVSPCLAHADIRQDGSSKCLRGVKTFNSVLSLWFRIARCGAEARKLSSPSEEADSVSLWRTQQFWHMRCHRRKTLQHNLNEHKCMTATHVSGLLGLALGPQMPPLDVKSVSK